MLDIAREETAFLMAPARQTGGSRWGTRRPPYRAACREPYPEYDSSRRDFAPGALGPWSIPVPGGRDLRLSGHVLPNLEGPGTSVGERMDQVDALSEALEVQPVEVQPRGQTETGGAIR